MYTCIQGWKNNTNAVNDVEGKKTKKRWMVHVRLELTTFALSARRSADWANGPALCGQLKYWQSLLSTCACPSKLKLLSSVQNLWLLRLANGDILNGFYVVMNSIEEKKKVQWSMWGSNSRPSRYQHDTLPTELMDQLSVVTSNIESHFFPHVHALQG